MKRKNILTIAITKYYDIKVEANESDLAWDEYMNNSGKRLKLIETDIQYHEFKLNKGEQNESRRTNQKKRS